MIKIEAFSAMTHEAAFRDSFPVKKGTKRHTKHLVSVSMCYPRHLNGVNA